MSKEYTFTILESHGPVENTDTKQHLWLYKVMTAYGELVVTIPGHKKPTDDDVAAVVRRAVDERP